MVKCSIVLHTDLPAISGLGIYLGTESVSVHGLMLCFCKQIVCVILSPDNVLCCFLLALAVLHKKGIFYL